MDWVLYTSPIVWWAYSRATTTCPSTLAHEDCSVEVLLYAAPQTTLDAGVQDAAYQALLSFYQELWDLDSQRLSEIEKRYAQKIEDLQAWGEFSSERFIHYKLRAPPRRLSSKDCEGSYGNLVKMLMMIKTTQPWMIMMWRTTSKPKKASRV
jgi:hypothetical protein